MEKVLITGSAGYLGEALAWTLSRQGKSVIGIDINASPYTTHLGSVTDAQFIAQAMHGVDTVFHVATLHKPHVVTHSKQHFIDTNVSGTQVLLDAAVAQGVTAFIFTSTTSAYGHAMQPEDNGPAAWVTEQLVPISKNIYGATKLAAENLCRLQHEQQELPCVVLRTSRFFPEEDDKASIRAQFSNTNAKANEFLNRRVELEDVVTAHLCAAEKAAEIGFGTYIISATSPFTQGDLTELHRHAPEVVAGYYPDFGSIYQRLGWRMFVQLDRVYVNALAREELNWQPRFDFRAMLDGLAQDGNLPESNVSRFVGSKAYHDEEFEDGPFPV
jgi:nucleoside-diphosphate-sugar epimerase